MKTIEYHIECHKRIFISPRGKRLVVWFSDYHVWTAPEFKLWQSKKYNRNEIILINKDEVDV